MSSSLWPYRTPGIPDHLFERLPGIPMSQRELRLLLISQLQLKADTVFWDIGAGTGTIPVEVGLLCPEAKVFAIERDEEVAGLIQSNCDRFNVSNVTVIQGSAPDCLSQLLDAPNCICIEGGRNIKAILQATWARLQDRGRIVATAYNLDSLYTISEQMAELQVRNIEVVQSAINRLETHGNHQVFVAVDPIFILSGEKFA
ncbi:MAG: precorrin-6Y C5,15-methyltransferase subunit CbiT [Leptolyngbyaceae bacterium]|nr:precorrin-6Y C5,15-methyltransferase subunit CbiT [Leptolyngbyaceae bacterium]